ncbi:hypothetical protein H696_06178 [Fonticula alba]|uniref:Kinetochore protein SPC25 n=1 Tax=Fonticula alba TaxID=691883 RepID=A0A058Z0E0_FONAL|nr:hypothetical protein H696_06178 [Fonticula alba]KCV67398.1 hypothetical protein H696_06178 [Fonticula alba]|eukprot:XP_009498196.1 hypothetical protein H696_06178 [Fonticula alba]
MSDPPRPTVGHDFPPRPPLIAGPPVPSLNGLPPPPVASSSTPDDGIADAAADIAATTAAIRQSLSTWADVSIEREHELTRQWRLWFDQCLESIYEQEENIRSQLLAREVGHQPNPSELQAVVLEKEAMLSQLERRSGELHRQVELLASQLASERKDQESRLRNASQLRRQQRATLHRMSKHLGLKVKGTASSLSFYFTCIERNCPDKEYKIAIRVTKERQYEVLASTPRLNPSFLGQQLRLLNATNDFGTFIRAVRQEFRRMAPG